MSRRLTLPQQRAIETRERILEAACRVFARRGFGSATVNDIAGQAEISVGALYHHFNSKEELFRAILDDHVRADLREFARLPTSATSLRELIEHFVTFWIEHFQSHREQDPLFMEFWAQAAREDWARAPVAGFLRHGRDLTREILRICQRAGVVRPDLDLEASSLLLHATVHGIWVERAIDPQGPDATELIGAFVDLIERFAGHQRKVDPTAFQEELSAWIDELGGRHASGDGGSTTRDATGQHASDSRSRTTGRG